MKTRSQAQALLGHTSARIAGRPIISIHAEIRVGDVLTMMMGDRVRVIRVSTLPLRRGPPAEARTCYDELAIDGAPR